MELPSYDSAAAVELIRDAIRARDGQNETVVRESLVANLSETFPRRSRPWWVERHILDAESNLRFRREGETVRGRADSVVGLTAIEYEADLRDRSRFTKGKQQVREYCAGLLNTGADPGKVRGVLSDSVEWHAYRLGATLARGVDDYDAAAVDLEEVEVLVCDSASLERAEALVDFLTRHLGREGARPLTAPSVAEYLGFDSGFGHAYLVKFDLVVQDAMSADRDAAQLIQGIWTSFMSYLSVEAPAAFAVETYVQEFYLSVLARLLCANVLERRPLRSDGAELDSILDGRLFAAKGLLRLVEHDYFGWLSRPEHIARVRPLAKSLQADLSAYDYAEPATEDVFGRLLSMLADRSQRILLGQEWTPAWLAARMAHAMLAALPHGERPRFVDMCCGSGSMLVETARATRELLDAEGVESGSQEYLDELVQAATGFDIDPLAVILAKVNWVVTNRDTLDPLDGSRTVSLPVYHADSLFALAPVFTSHDDTTTNYRLQLLDQTVDLPSFLVNPAAQTLFDGLLDRAYSLATRPTSPHPGPLDAALVDQFVTDVYNETGTDHDDEQRAAVIAFATTLTSTLTTLHCSGMNGVWAFVIRNSYRPGLVTGQFNGVISNPPWLAMSKIAHNPFAPVLRKKADGYHLVPPDSAFLHLDMSTVFLAHAVEHYLADEGLVACVLPDTVRTGCQHAPFRAQVTPHDGAHPRFMLRLDELWMVEPGVFKNRAVVAIGRRAQAQAVTQLHGTIVGVNITTPLIHYVATCRNRVVWSLEPPGNGVPGAYPRGTFAQGADVMPRSLIFFDVQPVAAKRVTVRALARDSDDWFLVTGAKKHRGFQITTRTIPDRFAHPCILSAHVGPFALAPPSLTVLPALPTDDHGWRCATGDELAAASTARDHFDQLVRASSYDTVEGFWKCSLDYRRKLSRQRMPLGHWLVVYGAGGGFPAAAYRYVGSDNDRVIVDQTLYWALVDTEDEALYLCGLINSDVLLRRIKDFIPEGEFGDRHLHTLPATAVPLYDPADDTHTAVVAATRELVAELDERRENNGEVGRLFTTTVSMNQRRRRLRKVIGALDTYQDYVDACEALYDALSPDDGAGEIVLA